MAKALYLCEEIDVAGGLVNRYGLVNGLRGPAFPHRFRSFCVFAQLSGGLGTVSIYVDVSAAAGPRVVHTSNVQMIPFASRAHLVQVSFRLPELVLPAPGVYLAELYCDSTWVADVGLEVREELS